MKLLKTVNIQNKKAKSEYAFLDVYTAGIVLTGTEIKSIRLGKVNFGDAFCIFKEQELFVKSFNISIYEQGTYNNHEPMRDRKLLLKKKELKKLQNKLSDKGLTIIPIRLFITETGYAKFEIALAKGKKLFDKRETIKDRDVSREQMRD